MPVQIGDFVFGRDPDRPLGAIRREHRTRWRQVLRVLLLLAYALSKRFDDIAPGSLSASFLLIVLVLFLVGLGQSGRSHWWTRPQDGPALRRYRRLRASQWGIWLAVALVLLWFFFAPRPSTWMDIPSFIASALFLALLIANELLDRALEQTMTRLDSDFLKAA